MTSESFMSMTGSDSSQLTDSEDPSHDILSSYMSLDSGSLKDLISSVTPSLPSPLPQRLTSSLESFFRPDTFASSAPTIISSGSIDADSNVEPHRRRRQYSPLPPRPVDLSELDEPATSDCSTATSGRFHELNESVDDTVPGVAAFCAAAEDQVIHLRDWLRYEFRLVTFYGWPFDQLGTKAICTSEAVRYRCEMCARNRAKYSSFESFQIVHCGFIALNCSKATTRCVLCDLELCWNYKDNPAECHLAYKPDCALAKLNKEGPFSTADFFNLCLNRLHHHVFPEVDEEQLYEIWSHLPPDFSAGLLQMYTKYTKPNVGESKSSVGRKEISL